MWIFRFSPCLIFQKENLEDAMKNKYEENETDAETDESNTKDELWKRYFVYQ